MDASLQAARQRFLTIALITIVAVYFLILVGGTVRATGAGMGCPDWPTCFGQLVPPTSEAELPADWRERYAARGYDTEPFDPIKTWTEYVNRLVGVAIGLLSIGTAVASVRLRQIDPIIPWAAFGGLFMVCFNGWLGSRVVASDLRPVMVSLHMIGAFAVQMCFILAWVRAREPESRAVALRLPGWMPTMALVTLAALTLQIFLGIQIRESVDLIVRVEDDLARDQWLNAVPWIFYVHRSFSWVVLALCVGMLWKAWHSSRSGVLAAAVGLTVFEMMLGGALNHLGFPLIAQPMHLLTAHLIFGVLWLIWAMCWVSRRVSPPLGDNSASTGRPALAQSQI